ncbi:hypothetical protein LguiB_030802 [Lonicera macranthoides]
MALQFFQLNDIAGGTFRLVASRSKNKNRGHRSGQELTIFTDDGSQNMEPVTGGNTGAHTLIVTSKNLLETQINM